jgi:hypothetical protein
VAEKGYSVKRGAAVRKALSVAVAGTLVGAIAFSGAPAEAATNATKPVSQSTARILSGSISTTNLDTIAKLAGIQAQNFGGATVSKDVTPDLSLLNDALTVPLGQLKGALTKAIPGLTLQGLLEEKAVAKSDGSATGDASVAGLGLDLGTLTAGATDALASLTLGLGAVTAHAQQAPNPNGPQSGSCEVAGLTLDLTSPLLANLVSTLTTALAPLSDLLSKLTTTVSSLPGLSGAISITGIPTVNSILNKLTDISLADGAIEINLKKGSVHIDLGALLGAAGLNFCAAPNSKPLKVLASALGDQIPTLLSDTINGAVQTALDLVDLCTTKTQKDCIRIVVGGVDIGDTLGANVLKPVTDLLSTLVGTVTTDLKPILASVGDVLGKLSDALAGIVDITTNKQTKSGGTFSETALELTLLSGAPTITNFAAGAPLLKVDLSNATVGPQSVLPTPTTTPPTTPTTTPPIKVNAGRPGPAFDGGVPLAWIGAVLLLGGVGGAALLRRKAARHS